LKEQLFGWTDPIAADENFEDGDENRTSQSSESTTEEPAQNVPKRLADLRNQLSNKQYALTAAKEAATFDETVRFNLKLFKIKKTNDFFT
jgi:hypothetical protein